MIINIRMTKTSIYHFNQRYLADFTDWITINDVKLLGLDLKDGRYEAKIVPKVFRVPAWLLLSWVMNSDE